MAGERRKRPGPCPDTCSPATRRDGTVWPAWRGGAGLPPAPAGGTPMHSGNPHAIPVMHHRGEKWSQGDIAARCAVSQSTVSRVLSGDPSYAHAYDSAASATTVTRNGTTYEMNTATPPPDLALRVTQIGYFAESLSQAHPLPRRCWRCEGEQTCQRCHPKKGVAPERRPAVSLRGRAVVPGRRTRRDRPHAPPMLPAGNVPHVPHKKAAVFIARRR